LIHTTPAFDIDQRNIDIQMSLVALKAAKGKVKIVGKKIKDK
jgi:hypothetical protein